MPEGDTLHKVAMAMAPRLVGQALSEVRTRGGVVHGRLAGRRVAAVRAVGKHLVVELDDGTAIRSHLGMKGTWHVYAPGERWWRSAAQAGLVLATAAVVFVCFHPHEVHVLAAKEAARDPGLARLGPDVLADDFDPRDAVARARARTDTPIAEVLLDQGVACGIGNVYKCEVLFIERVDPFAPVARLDDDVLAALYARAQALMRANLGPGRRVTTGAAAREWGRHHVYRRAGRPCPRCRTPIRSLRQGVQARMTYWCPRCQAGRVVEPAASCQANSDDIGPSTPRSTS
jgi:endonuclease-8